MTTTITIAINHKPITITIFERRANLFGERGEFDAVHEIVALLSPKSESTQQSKLAQLSSRRHDNDDSDNYDDTKDNK